jgi:serine protease Do
MRIPTTIRWQSIGFIAICASLGASIGRADDSLAAVAREVRPKIVKIYGAGGLRGLEAYQSGMLISAGGDVLTAWSYVLDSDDVAVVLDDGRRYTATLVGADPLTEVAVLKIDSGAEQLPYFDLRKARAVEVGTRVLAFSNLFGIATGNEPVSMLQGYVSVVAPLEARRGGFSTNYRGDVYIVDAATNNPGASGGALVDGQGRLVGMLGKELRSELTDTWLNYALPVTAFADTVDAIRAGDFTPKPLTDADRPDHPLSLSALGIVLVPNVVSRTPPYVDRVLPGSAAEKAGLRPDDLIVMIDTNVVASRQQADSIIERFERDATVRVSVLRDEALLEFSLAAPTSAESGKKE